jgi:hypothetical protein
VQRVGHFARLACALLARQNIWCLCILTLAAVTANAGEPVIKLASARDYQPLKKSAVFPNEPAVIAHASASETASSNRKNSELKNSTLESSTNFTDLSNVELEKQVRVQAESPLTLFRRNLSAYDRPNTWVSVEAGYGQVWHDEFTLQSEFTKRQQPTFAYVTASFSF